MRIFFSIFCILFSTLVVTIYKLTTDKKLSKTFILFIQLYKFYLVRCSITFLIFILTNNLFISILITYLINMNNNEFLISKRKST